MLTSRFLLLVTLATASLALADVQPCIKYAEPSLISGSCPKGFFQIQVEAGPVGVEVGAQCSRDCTAEEEEQTRFLNAPTLVRRQKECMQAATSERDRVACMYLGHAVGSPIKSLDDSILGIQSPGMKCIEKAKTPMAISACAVNSLTSGGLVKRRLNKA